MKKISVTTWLILGGIFLYTASLWQRPLFISEFAWGSLTIDALHSGKVAPVQELPLFFIFRYLGISPFSMRIVPALLALLSAGAILLAGRKSRFSHIAEAGPLIFLLTPAVFLCGTTALPHICNGAFVVISFYQLLLMSGSKTLLTKVLSGSGAAAALVLSRYIPGNLTFFSVTLTAWLVYTVSNICLAPVEEKKRKFITGLYSLIPFVPALFPFSSSETLFQLPQLQQLKSFTAAGIAGAFPWVIFLPAVLRNFRHRFGVILRDPFTQASFILSAVSLITAFFTPAGAAFFIPFLAGAAVLLAAGLLMEQEENGFHSANVCFYILAVVFFLAAAGIAIYSTLGIYTKLLDPAWKLFNAKDAWALSSLVPAVAAVWCLTGAGEKISKERKFLSLCAGTAFLLLAFHGLVPLKVVEYNAPVNFLQKVVMVRTGTKAVFYGDQKMFAPLQSVFKSSTVKRVADQKTLAEIKEALKAGQKLCVVTCSRALSNKLPFPKTTLRSGSFTAVFYNIDFPEMRVRKP